MRRRRALSSGSAEHGTSESGTPHLGLTLAPANETGAGDRGVAITAVDPNGPAAEHGVRTGDVILVVAGKAASSPADVRKELASLHKAGKHTVLMPMKSGDTTKGRVPTRPLLCPIQSADVVVDRGAGEGCTLKFSNPPPRRISGNRGGLPVALSVYRFVSWLTCPGRQRDGFRTWRG